MNGKVFLSILGGVGALAILLTAAAALSSKSDRDQPVKLIDSLEGRLLYQEYCMSCHGKEGKGDGPLARVLKTPPADLTRIAMRHGGKFPRKQIEAIISGEADVAAHGTRDMPLWGPIFSQVTWDEDLGQVRIDNLARYLETIQR